MPTCPHCATEVGEDTRFCSSCGGGLETDRLDESAPTLADAPGSLPPTTESLDSGRFPAGTMLGDRYRIVGLLGRGGMGEVYKAEDLKLHQVVALKFLPEELQQDPVRMQRFRDEIRLSLKVTHPNVCRVYDLGELDGHAYLSMEYVDGEDLGTSLRRIGRFPEESAVEIARQICAGLAAAHAQGILHRDLKPANVMLDGRGRVRLTDFGLAGVEGEGGGEGGLFGTPAYMAPEQLRGQKASAQSDIYSLGLVLYEVFTGKRTWRMNRVDELLRAHRSSQPVSPSSHVSGLDPAVERVILRCLEEDPSQRPASALAVMAALPGGDPLAAAIAAGETPSPEMVAGAGKDGRLSPGVAVALLVTTLAAMITFTGLHRAQSPLDRIGLDKPPAALVERAEELADTYGPEAQPDVRAWDFAWNGDYFTHITDTDDSLDRWDVLDDSRPPAVLFWYRQAPVRLGLLTFQWRISYSTPPMVEPGMVNVILSPAGDLLQWRAVPEHPVEPEEGEPVVEIAPMDWEKFLGETGLDFDTLAEVEPKWFPPVYADERRAWAGAYEDGAGIEFRIEAAALRGKPVYLEVAEPWADPPGGEGVADFATLPPQFYVLISVLVFLILGFCWLAFRNFRSGRGDRRGAFRIASALLALLLGSWLLVGYHPGGFGEVFQFLSSKLPVMLLAVSMVWLMYLAIEPYARRVQPHMCVSWSRLLAGRLWDPLVGRDILVGMGVGMILGLINAGSWHIYEMLGAPMPAPLTVPLTQLLAPRFLAGGLLYYVGVMLLNGLVVPLLFIIFRVLLRRNWLAYTAAFLMLTLFGLAQINVAVVDVPVAVLSAAVILYVLKRFGILSVMIVNFSASVLLQFHATWDFTAWYGLPSAAVMVLIAALAVYGFWVSLAGQAVFWDSVFEE